MPFQMCEPARSQRLRLTIKVLEHKSGHELACLPACHRICGHRISSVHMLQRISDSSLSTIGAVISIACLLLDVVVFAYRMVAMLLACGLLVAASRFQITRRKQKALKFCCGAFARHFIGLVAAPPLGDTLASLHTTPSPWLNLFFSAARAMVPCPAQFWPFYMYQRFESVA